MTRFSYSLKTINGTRETGWIEASSEEEANDIFEKQGHVLLSVRALSDIHVRLGKIFNAKHHCFDQLAFFTALETSVRSGLDLITALKLSFPLHKTILREHSIALLHNGYSLSHSLYKTGICRIPIIIMRLKTSEKTGDLKTALKDIVDYLTWSQSFTKTLRKTLQYPLFVFILTMCLSIFLIVYVLPNLITLFETIGYEIPSQTHLLLTAFHALPFLGLLIVMSISMGSMYFMVARSQKPQLKKLINGMKAIHPHFTGLLYFWVLIFKPLSYLYRSHRIDIIETLSFIKTLYRSQSLTDLIADMIHEIKGGTPLYKTFDDHLGLPSSYVEILKIGEDTNDLKYSFLRISDHIEAQLIENVNHFTATLGPFLLLFVGGLIILLVITIIMPLYDSLGSLAL